MSRRFVSTARQHLIFGANTDVGKTVLTAGLVRCSASAPCHYIKPLQCGGSDEAFVNKYITTTTTSAVTTQTLYTWETPASPHVASIQENLPVSNEQVLTALNDAIMMSTAMNTTWIETAGGVLSPGCASPDNNPGADATTTTHNQQEWGWSLQANLYQPLATTASVVLVGDGKLGGISATLAAYESLVTRKYEVAGILLIDNEEEYDNASALKEYLPLTRVQSLPALPPPEEPLYDWYDATAPQFKAFDGHLKESWEQQ